MRVIKKAALVGLALFLFVMTATPANNAENVVFSKTGGFMALTGNDKNTGTPFGFWIWCQPNAPSTSHGIYSPACAGSMYFYSLAGHAFGIVGEITENKDGSYTASILGESLPDLIAGVPPAFACTLTNVPPVTNGHTNEVIASCPFFSSDLGGGTGAATVTDAVVNVTGPN